MLAEEIKKINYSIGEGLGVTTHDNAPKFLEAIAMQLGQKEH